MLRGVKEVLLAEISSYIIWLVIFFAFGIGFYFSLDNEPSLSIVFLVSLVIFVVTLLLRNCRPILFLLLPILFFSFGITVATWRTHNIKFDKLVKPIKNAKIYGVVENIFHSDKKSVRLILNIKKLYTDEKINLKKIQITIMNFNHDVKVGDFISLYTSLFPSSGRLFPNSYDFARHAYFQKIAATGFSISKIRIIEPARDNSILTKIENLRLTIFHILQETLGQVNGSIAVALMIGEQKAINAKVLNDMRYSGLTHILAVSGLHMSLVAAICFFIVRRFLSYSVFIAQKYNTKKLAAWASLILSFVYLLISGTRIAALRSFIMLSSLMIGVLIDRQNNPRRSVFFAAFLILFFTPESILHPGFQMSFSAVIALIATYEVYTKKISIASKNRSIFSSIKFYFLGVIISSFVAGTVTSIFAMYHFHNYSNYSVLANLLVAPIVSFIIMPSVVLTFFLLPLPFGIYKLGAYILGLGIGLMLKVAGIISALPKSIFVTPTTDIIIPILFIFGLLWVCVWEKRWRILGLIPMGIAFVMIFMTPFPDIIIDNKYKAVLINNKGNKNALIQLSGSKRISNFHKAQWFNLLDTNQKSEIISEVGFNKIMKKIYKINLYLQDSVNMCVKKRDAVKLSKLIITNLKTNSSIIISKEDIEKYGSYFIYLKGNKVVVKRSFNKSISRPWSV
ncbi:MAG: ComEC/Rec2 family competence protein [Rickettsiales bacterium]|nr:ComEC/Rec2 family competence protein [Rickettsiales bacterium]